MSEQEKCVDVTIVGSPIGQTSIELPLPVKRATGKKRRVVKVKRGPGKGRIRKSWLRGYKLKFTFSEDNGTPIRDFFNTWTQAVIKPAEYTEQAL